MESSVTVVEIHESGKAQVQETGPIAPFVMLFQDILVKCADNPMLRGESRRLLDYILGTLRMGNQSVVINQTELAVRWNTSQSHISRALRILCRYRILLKGHRAGRGTIYRLNPHWVWRGEGKDNLEARTSAPLPLFPSKVASLDARRRRGVVAPSTSTMSVAISGSAG